MEWNASQSDLHLGATNSSVLMASLILGWMPWAPRESLEIGASSAFREAKGSAR